MALTEEHKVFNWIKNIGKSEVKTYFGPFDFSVINDRLIEIKAYLSNAKIDKFKNKMAYSILVESLENVIKHGEYKGHTAAFMMYTDEISYFITVVNPLSPDTAIQVKSKFDNLFLLNWRRLNK